MVVNRIGGASRANFYEDGGLHPLPAQNAMRFSTGSSR